MNLHILPRHQSQVSVEFIRGMVSRMAMSFEKYGDVREAYPHKVDALKSLQQRLDKYQDTGNTEFLIDAANFAMIEFLCPKHSDAHYRATDSSESPGRIGTRGPIGQEANTSSRENVRRGGAIGRTAGGFYRSEGD